MPTPKKTLRSTLAKPLTAAVSELKPTKGVETPPCPACGEGKATRLPFSGWGFCDGCNATIYKFVVGEMLGGEK